MIEPTMPLKLGILVSYLRQEEKLILAAARARGIDVVPLFDRDLALNLSAPTAKESGVDIDVLLDRSVVHSRAGYTLHAMTRWGIPTLNSAVAVTICDDKARASMELEAAGIPSPKTYLAYSANAAIEACEALGYPAVLKPVTGSWGRLLAKVNGPEQARAIIAQKAEHGSFHHEIFCAGVYREAGARHTRVCDRQGDCGGVIPDLGALDHERRQGGGFCPVRGHAGDRGAGAEGVRCCRGAVGGGRPDRDRSGTQGDRDQHWRRVQGADDDD